METRKAVKPFVPEMREGGEDGARALWGAWEPVVGDPVDRGEDRVRR
jgi:hypothetical protein